MLKSSLNEYRYLFNALNQAVDVSDEGNLDLNFRLSFFHEKIKKTNNNKLINRFEKDMSAYIPDTKELAPSSTTNKTNLSDLSNDVDSKTSNQPSWVKKLYRQVAVITHPDKTSGLKPESIRALMVDHFEIASAAYEKNRSVDVMMVANELNIGISSNKEKIKIVSDGIKEKREELARHHASLGYQWNFINENDKPNYFKKILNSLGFKYTDQEVDTIVKKKRPVNASRQPNERPKKGILNRKRR